MRASIRFKLLGTYLLLLLVMGSVLYLYLNRTLEQQLVNGIRDQLQSQGTLAALTVNRDPGSLEEKALRLAPLLATPIHTRVTLVTATGEVVGDSEVPIAEIPHMENHRNRPEILSALAGGFGSAIRHSATLNEDMLYVALRLDAARPEIGIIRLALPLQAVTTARASLHKSLILGFLLASLLVGGLSLFLTQFSTRILQTLTTGAERFAAGDLRRRIPIISQDEFGQLAQVLNTMAEQLQQQMDRLANDRNRLDAILRGMGEGLLVADRDGTVRLTNPAFSAQFGVGEDALGRPLIELSRHPSLHENFRTTINSRRTCTAEMSLGSEQGTILLAHWTPLLDEGRVAGVVAVFHDISDLKRLERIRRDFVANVSHELRTPVTVIGGYAETLTGGICRKDPETAERFAGIIHTHAERLSALIADLLTLSQLESGGFALQLSPVVVTERIARSASLLEPKAAGKGVTIELPEASSLQVMADPQRLEQILVNLLDNAVKYSPTGGTVQVEVSDEGAKVAITIRDCGPGIPAAALPRLFERFYRVDAARSRDIGGTGLGLSIVKHLVQLHGGSVTVESRLGEGSSFTVRLTKEQRT